MTSPSSQVAGHLLAATAGWTAAARARETERGDALVRDPWAAALAGEAGAAWIASRPPDSTLPMILRTRYFDDYLQAVAAEGVTQVVLLAAGLDTRAYRLAWPAGTHVYELDQASVIRYKEQVLATAGAAPTCERRAITADLTEPWQEKLVAAGFDPDRPAAWLLEGFLFYLPSAEVVTILDSVATWAARGSRLGFDIINAAMLTNPYTRPWVEMQARAGAPWIGTLDDPVEFLTSRGWQVRLTQAGQPDAHYGRWTLPVLPVSAPGFPHNWFVTATKG